jgi:hypothetical protein
VLGLLAVLSCSASGRIHVFNNTLSVLRISGGDEKLEIEPGTALSTTWGGDLIAQVDGRGVRYDIPFPPPGYVKAGFFRTETWVQVDHGGRVFVLKVGDKPPIDGESYAQPPGFPVSPLAP